MFVCFLGRSLTGSMFHCICLVSWVFTSFAGFAQTFIFVCSLNQEKHRWKMYNNVQKVKTKRKILVKKNKFKKPPNRSLSLSLSLSHLLLFRAGCFPSLFSLSSLSLVLSLLSQTPPFGLFYLHWCRFLMSYLWLKTAFIRSVYSYVNKIMYYMKNIQSSLYSWVQ